MHTVSSFYHISKNEVLDGYYFDELLDIVKLIQKTKLEEYLMLSQISLLSNSKKPKEFINELKRELSSINKSLKIKLSSEQVDQKKALDMIKNLRR